MCGIVGVISKYKTGLFKQQADVFKQLFLMDQIRGTDGAGIIYDKNYDVYYHKSPTPAGVFMSNKHFNDCMDEAVKDGHFIIGHNRAATKGSHIWKNTHPFSEGPITLVHNGTLWDHKNLDKDAEVDSHAICIHMDKEGVEKTLKEIDGAFALVWTNNKDKTINLARNTERPLHLIETTAFWIISSELGLGLWIAERNNIKVIDSFQLKTETLYTFDMNDTSKFTTKEVEYSKWTTQGNTGYGAWWNKYLPKEEKKHEVIPFTKKKDIPPTRGYGTEATFSPNRLVANDAVSSIVFDDKRMQHFILGKREDEKENDYRVYGKYDDLVELAANDFLTGKVYLATIRGAKTIYTMENVVESTETFPSLEDAKNELALQAYLEKNGFHKKRQLIKCDCCSEHTPRKLITIHRGVPLCDICATAFENNPNMAQQMGYC